MCQRDAVYTDLMKALTILRIVDDKTPKTKVFHAMWLLETKQLKVGFNINVSPTEIERYYCVAHKTLS